MKNSRVHAFNIIRAGVLIFSFIGITKAQPLIVKSISGANLLNIYDVHSSGNGTFLFAGSDNQPTFDSSMAVLIKTDSALQPVWQHRYKALHKDYLFTISASMDGNIFLGGTIRENFNQISGGSVIKIDTSGTVLWHKVYSDSYDDAVIKIVQQADSTLMIFIREGVNNYPTKIIHADKDGNVISKRSYFDGIRALFADNVTHDFSGNYFLTGDIYSSVTSTFTLFVCKLNDTSLTWSREYFFGRDITSPSITYLSDGTLGIAASIRDTLYPNTYNGIILKLDANGTMIWSREFGQQQAYNEFAGYINASDNGSMIVLGQTSTAAGFESMALKADSAGNILWSNSYSSLTYSFMNKELTYPDGRLLLVSTNNIGAYLFVTATNGVASCNSKPLGLVNAPLLFTDSFPSITMVTPSVNAATPALVSGNTNVTVGMVCTGGVGINDFEAETELRIFPQPASAEINVVCDTKEPFVIYIYNSTGELSFVSHNQREIDVHNLQPGLYLLNFKSATQTTSRKFVIMR